MTKGHVLGVSLLLVTFLFTGVTTLGVHVPKRVTLSQCCGGDCRCPPGQCECCGHAPEVEHSVPPNQNESQANDTAFFWRSLAFTGHTTVLFHFAHDPYMHDFGPIALFDDVYSWQEEPGVPIIEDSLILPPDKVPRLLS